MRNSFAEIWNLFKEFFSNPIYILYILFTLALMYIVWYLQTKIG
ncbi:hypothetical protein JGI7_01182 [Candidatus Kryptonium thompsonii]|uniref:Uncharacterized protein n=1 Tax=Candidatus Kryptonium thompsonii TaxID=1633631 RepID=A0A0P1MD17_9BACT|nr:hypothetical protein [Candidatus Kryptonium thompsoni]CUS77269.1 hypothetical protein JGI8_00105 [Candidatus Kryptonium thompsoni]CUS79151.1 hypothetical protein JGI16_101614 [Candidatus Kryptonium thompsoni]CUS85248.1 hypothetical protein JGI13_01164 [Candidatus Kryptonium thompsoni]CUS86564.1 hypothetical protein JGI10_01263 [Candidatus Kryptonium thompsoni]CUS88181.1 hypothetical protein JGI7_01182 [Candidatus Kryptonium thompsoni]